MSNEYITYVYYDELHAENLKHLFLSEDPCEKCPANFFKNEDNIELISYFSDGKYDECEICETFIYRYVPEELFYYEKEDKSISCPCHNFGHERALELTEKVLAKYFPTVYEDIFK